MKHCEKCIHYELCKSRMEFAPDDTFSFFPYNEDCPHFKNKADFAEVKHGEWKTVFVEHGYHKECSICGAVWMLDGSKHICIETDYCYKCGAKMDGGEIQGAYSNRMSVF